MVEDYYESVCEKHGLDRHVFVHEAGHAVAAVDNGVEFRAIALYDPAAMPKFGLFEAPAAVEPLGTAKELVEPNPDGALLYVLGGFAAEEAVLGHALQDGFREDLAVWRRGRGCTDEMTPAELDEVVGRPFVGVIEEARQAAISNADRIDALAGALAEHPAPWEMPYADVVQFLAEL